MDDDLEARAARAAWAFSERPKTLEWSVSPPPQEAPADERATDDQIDQAVNRYWRTFGEPSSFADFRALYRYICDSLPATSTPAPPETEAEERLKALEADAKRLEWLRANLCWDGYGFWLPDVCIKVGEFEDPPTRDQFDAGFDSAIAGAEGGER